MITIKTYPVTGMSCTACAASVENILKGQQGVDDASVNYASATVKVKFNENVTSGEMLKSAVQTVGYDIIIDENKDIADNAAMELLKKLKFNTIGAILLATPVFIIGMFFMNMPYANWIMLILSTPVICWFGRHYFVNAYRQTLHLRANMDTLVALSTGISFAFSVFNTIYPHFWHSRGLHSHVYFEAATVVIAFLMLGKLLEERAKANTSSAIKKLMGLQSKTVTVITDNGEEQEISIALIKTHDKLIVKPGERVPVDGTVIAGSSFVDESSITGEPVPVEKYENEKVFAGTLNQNGSFVLRAEKVGSETMLARIIKMVQEAQGSKPPAQKLADKIAGVFVPTVIAISIVSFIVWYAMGGDNAFHHALLAMVTVLVVACPCALGLAIPTAIMVSVGKGAENGILIKDSEGLEALSKVTIIVFDKTGTITEGKPQVKEIVWNQSLNTAIYKPILYSIESKSAHPLADAVCKFLNTDKNNWESELFENITGKGVKAKLKDDIFLVGNSKLMEEYHVDSQPLENEIKSFQNNGFTTSLFAINTTIVAVIAIEDKIKASAKTTILNLKNKGIEVCMLTGDNEQTAAYIAAQAGITNFKAGLMPSDKAEYIKSRQEKGEIVAMVGDGINDSPALNQADVSIAMGKGSDIAIDIAKITINSNDLTAISRAINLSKFTLSTIKQNLFWVFIYNTIAIPIAAGVLYPFGITLNPMIAGAAMALSSISVVSNSLRLKTKSLK